MRILHYVNESRLAWASPFIQLLLALEERGAENSVLCSPGGTLPAMLKDAGIRFFTEKATFPWFPPACFNIGRAIKKARPDIIVSRLSSASLIGGYWGKKIGIPVVGVLDKFSKRKYYRYTDAVQAVSSALLEYAKINGFPPSTLIPNGIDTARYDIEPVVRLTTREVLGVEKDALLVAGAGRFVDWKGFDILLLAFAELKKEFPLKKMYLLIAGDGERRTQLKKLAAECNLVENVLFPGFVSDIRPFLKASDIFVLPSKEPEPFGLVLLEAMASGLPVIATDVGGPRDMIQQGFSGWLIPPNDPGGLALALKQAVLHPDLSTIARNALGVSRRFDQARVAADSLMFYKRCASRADSSGSKV